jgi:hypothetical protein
MKNTGIHLEKGDAYSLFGRGEINTWPSNPDKKRGLVHPGRRTIARVTQATLKQTLYSLAGLFLAIIKNGSCSNAINQAGWFFSDFHNPGANLNDERSSEQKPDYYFTVESRLFSYAVGWSKVAISRKDQWFGDNSSPRSRFAPRCVIGRLPPTLFRKLY